MVTTRSFTQSIEASKKIFHGGSHHYEHNFQIGDEFSDVTVKVGKLSIKTHKCVLQAFSPYFDSMFTRPFKENEADTIELHTFDEGAVKSLIEMAYSKRLTVDITNVQNVFHVAQYLLMDELKVFCENFLIEQLYTVNVFWMRHLGLQFCLKNLFTRADRIIVKNFAETTSTDEFLSLDKYTVISYISRPDLEVKLEEHIFEACKLWVEHDIDSRSTSMCELLQHVRLAVVTSEYLSNVIANFPPCKSSTGCQRLIINAEFYHANPSQRSEVDVGNVKPRGFHFRKIYIFNTCSIISFVNDRYEKIANVTKEDLRRGVAVLEGEIYVTGGYRFDGDPANCNARCVNEVSIFSPDDKKLTPVAPMNLDRHGHGCCSHAGALFVCGGEDGFASFSCEKLLIGEKKWIFVADMKMARTHFTLVSCGNYMWAFGGYGEYDRCVVKGTLDTTEYYDENKNEWRRSTPMTEGRSGHSAVAFRDSIYVIGGRGHDEEILCTAEVFDTKTKQFSSLSSMRVPRNWFGAAISEHKLYCFSGLELNSVESFDLYIGKWIEEINMPEYGDNSSALAF